VRGRWARGIYQERERGKERERERVRRQINRERHRERERCTKKVEWSHCEQVICKI